MASEYQNITIQKLMAFAKTLDDPDYFLDRIPKNGSPLSMVRKMNEIICEYSDRAQDSYDRLVYQLAMEGILGDGEAVAQILDDYSGKMNKYQNAQDEKLKLEAELEDARMDAKMASYKVQEARDKVLRFENREFFDTVGKAMLKSTITKKDVNSIIRMLKLDLFDFTINK